MLLVDVDCNLWHGDLKPLLYPSSSAANGDSDDNDGDAFDERIRVLLTEDAVAESNIVAVLSPSSTLAEARRGLEFLHRNSDRDGATSSSSSSSSLPPPLKIRTTVGVHPYHVRDSDVAPPEQAGDEIRRILDEESGRRWIAAIGECGLDGSEGFPPLEEQLPYFEEQVRIARRRNLPLFVHERLAFEQCTRILDDNLHTGDDAEQARTPAITVLVHCFTGTRQHCRAYIERGYYLSISGYLFKEEDDPTSEVRACLEEGLVPLDRLMVETDAPYMGFEGCRTAFADKNRAAIDSLGSKKRRRLVNSYYPNVPSSLPQVLDRVLYHINKGRSERQGSGGGGEESAALLTREQLAAYTTSNANRFFRFGLEGEEEGGEEL